MSTKIKLGILGGGGDSLIGELHRVAAKMHDHYEIIGGVFNPDHKISLEFGKKIGLDKSSNVLLIGCEGNVDNNLYNKLYSKGKKRLKI